MQDGFQIAVDIGGTFTDGILLRKADDALYVAKSLTTADNPGKAVETVVRSLIRQSGAPADMIERIVHGTTLVTNTLVERRGVRFALVLTAGTRDCLDIRRELRYDIYDLEATYPQALVALDDRFELEARLSPSGEVWTPLDEPKVSALATEIKNRGYQAVAVCLLHSPVNDAHEHQVGALVRAQMPEIPVSLSSEVAREIGEYERMSTVAANAYVQPVVMAYLSTLGSRLQELGIGSSLDIMLSNGAFTNAALASAAPIRILESGPAGGVLSAINCGLDAAINKVLAFDMGGTTAKASLAVEGQPAITHEFEFGRVKRFKRGSGLPVVAPSIDLIEIGAGGGSLATINPLGLLQVGPMSAGSAPGPACYGLGGERATVTDADLVLGYLDPNYFLGGSMTLSTDLARDALARSGAPLDLSVEATAWGIYDIVNENMASAARSHIAERGLDAREFTLVATGGAGPVHAVDVARRLRIQRILCPIASGVGSCLGFLAAPARADRSWSKVEPLTEMDERNLERRLAEAVESIGADLRACGLAPDDIQWRLSAEVRYVGQGNTVDVPLASTTLSVPTPEQVLSAFQSRYRALYGRLIDHGIAEVVTWRLTGSSHADVRQFKFADQTLETEDPSLGQRRAYLPDVQGYRDIPVYHRYRLQHGTALAAPLILVEPESTLVVAYPGEVRVLDGGTVQVLLKG